MDQNLKGVIFDMDGVLVNSEPVYLKLINEIYQEIGADVDYETHLTSLGVSSLEWWDYIIKNYQIKNYTKEELANLEWSKIYQYFQELKPEDTFGGVYETLKKLKEKGLKLALASSNISQIVHLILNQLKIKDLFDFIITGDNPELEKSKPDPQIFKLALNGLKLNNSEAIVVEDSESGLQAAKSAGLKTLCFLSAPKKIKLDNADYTFDNYNAFFDVLEEIKLDKN